MIDKTYKTEQQSEEQHHHRYQNTHQENRQNFRGVLGRGSVGEGFESVEVVPTFDDGDGGVFQPKIIGKVHLKRLHLPYPPPCLPHLPLLSTASPRQVRQGHLQSIGPKPERQSPKIPPHSQVELRRGDRLHIFADIRNDPPLIPRGHALEYPHSQRSLNQVILLLKQIAQRHPPRIAQFRRV